MVRPLRALRAFCSITPLFFSILFLALASTNAAAQEPAAVAPAGAEAPAHIAFVDGVVILERDGDTDDSPLSMPLLAGDRVRTRGGRVEILFADGSTLHMDHNSVIDLQSDELVRLVQGRIRLSIPGPQRTVGYRIDGPQGWALIDEPGEYRVALLNAPTGSELELAVIRGRAELANDGGRTPLRAGERAFVRASAAPSYAFVANSASMDAFDRWSELRRDERMGASAQYLPDEVRPYAASLDRHGYWRDEPTYGRVWYPRVSSDWRPYYRGRWANLRPYGWTWIGHDPWGWPTHHYGRWGYAGTGWFWIPGRSWGAAWVSWASAPGYVSWCPLGWNNRPVIQINVNIGRHYDPWYAWTVLPRHHFGRGYVHRNVVRIDHLDARTRGAFRIAERVTVPRDYPVSRATTPIRTAGRTAGRRADSPVYSNLPPDQARMRSDGSRIRVPNGIAPIDSPENRRAENPQSSIGARERTTPARPATRSSRPVDTASEERTATPREDRGRTETPSYSAPRGARPNESAPPRVERYGRSPETTTQPPAEAPRYRRESPPSVRENAPSTDGGPSRRALPREDARPRAAEPQRVPEGARRAPDRPSSGSSERPSGSYERRAPERSSPAAPPSASPRSGGERPSGSPAGARPRPSGGGTGRTATRR